MSSPTIQSARPYFLRFFSASILGAISLAMAVGLLASSAWLISMAATQPPVLTLQVAVVSVRFFGISRGFFRYTERIWSHDAILRSATSLQLSIYRALVKRPPISSNVERQGKILQQLTSDIEVVQDRWIRLAIPFMGALISGWAGIGIITWLAPNIGLLNLALLNQNTLRSMPFTRFITQIRPVLVNEFPYIKNSYITSFTHLIEHTPVEEMTDEQRNRLTLKKLSLQYPELNEQEILMIHNLFNVVHYNLPLEEFIQNIRPIMIRMPGLQREYIENLNEFVDGNNERMQHNPDWDELQEYDRMNAENTLFRRHIYALEHPESTAAQTITAVQF